MTEPINLLSPLVHTLSLDQIETMTDAEAEVIFRQMRWPPDGVSICPKCGAARAYEYRRGDTDALVFRCRSCVAHFSATSNTLFASHKLSVRSCLKAIVLFVHGGPGYRPVQLSRDLGVNYRTAFSLANRFRQALSGPPA